MPEIVLCITAIFILLITAFRNKHSFSYIFSLAGILISICFNLFFWNFNVSAFDGMIKIDNLSILFSLFILVAAFLVNIISVNYTSLEEKFKGEYYSLILFSTVGMTLMTKTSNLVILFIALEIFSLALYILVGLCKDKALSYEASLKYFLTGAFTSAIFLYGIAFVYGTTGILDLQEFNWNNISLSTVSIIGFLFILVGFLFKIGIVPFHMWIPDTYQGSPTTVTAFMSVAVKIAIFAPIIRIFSYSGFSYISSLFSNVFVVLTILTMTIGNVIAISQINIKRMLAYSSIAHAGYMMLAFLPSKDFSATSIIFYLATYIFMNIGSFAVVTILERKNKLNISDYSGLSSLNPFLALLMAVFLLSLTGIPPTAGFIAKLYIFSYAIKSGYLIPVIIAVINSVISAYYYLRIIIVMYMKQPEVDEASSLSLLTLIVIIISAILILYLGIFPDQLLKFLNSI